MLTTFPTVFTVVVGVYTYAVAVRLPLGTSRLDTFALVTIVLARTIFNLIGILITATSILGANLVLARNLGSFGGTLEGVFLALGVRAVGNTFVLIALFKVLAECPTFTLAPNSSTTFLGAFDTSLAVGGQAATSVTRCTLEALVFDASWFAFFGTVFVFETFNTPASAIAFLAGGTIFVGTADALIILCTLLCWAAVRLTVCVL